MMFLLVKNHRKKDENIRYKKENARRILKEKQRAAQELADRTKKLRLLGELPPEDFERQEASRLLSEEFLL